MISDEVRCGTCGLSAAFPGANRCTNCWETEKRLGLYMATKAGRNAVRRALAETEPDAVEALAERITGEAVKIFRDMLPHETGSYNAGLFRARVVELLREGPRRG